MADEAPKNITRSRSPRIPGRKESAGKEPITALLPDHVKDNVFWITVQTMDGVTEPRLCVNYTEQGIMAGLLRDAGNLASTILNDMRWRSREVHKKFICMNGRSHLADKIWSKSIAPLETGDLSAYGLGSTLEKRQTAAILSLALAVASEDAGVPTPNKSNFQQLLEYVRQFRNTPRASSSHDITRRGIYEKSTGVRMGRDEAVPSIPSIYRWPHRSHRALCVSPNHQRVGIGAGVLTRYLHWLSS